MKKVLYIVLQNFKNDSRVLKQCSSLFKNNYSVSVVALHEDGLSEKENINNIDVHRLKLKTKKLPKNLIFQLLKYLEFAMKIIKNYRKVDIINASSFGPLPVAMLMKLITFGRIKVVYDARELESQTVLLKGLKKKLLIFGEKILLRYVNGMSTVSNSIADDYVQRYSIEKPFIIMNSPPIQEIKRTDIFRQTFHIDKDSKILLYQGGLNKGRGIELLIESFIKLDRKDVALVIMGYGALSEYVKEIEGNFKNIYYHEAVSPLNLLEYTASADIGILLIENVCLSYYYCLPNKFFEYAMAGLPIIASNLYELSKMVNKYNCGILTELDTNAVANSIEEILNKNLEQLSINSRSMAIENSWEEQEKQLLTMYNKL